MTAVPTNADLVTVVIAVKNGQAHIVEAVESALAQGPALDRVIVVDDGSTDSTRHLLSTISDPRLVVLDSPGAGVSAARNAGALAACSPWLLFLDADDRLAPGAVATLAAAARPGAVAAYGDYERIDDAGRRFGRRHLVRQARSKPSGHIFETMLAGNFFINGGVVVCSKSSFEEAGGFDQRLTLCEDWHLWCRLAMQGPIYYAPWRVLDYRVHSSSVMMRKRRLYEDFQPALHAIFSDPAIRDRVAAEKLSRLRRTAETSLMTYCAQQALRARDYEAVSSAAFAAIVNFPAKTPWILGRLAGAWASL